MREVYVLVERPSPAASIRSGSRGFASLVVETSPCLVEVDSYAGETVLVSQLQRLLDQCEDDRARLLRGGPGCAIPSDVVTIHDAFYLNSR